MNLTSFGKTVLAIAVAVLVAGGSASAAELPKDANTTCPVMIEEAVDPDLYVEYKGKRIYVCCNKCKRQFMKSPEKFLAQMKPNDQETTPTRKGKSPSEQ